MQATGYCPRCGRPTGRAGSDHDRCRSAAAELDPPRFCGRCGGRLDVRVFSTGYRATCRRCDRVHPARDPLRPDGPAAPPA